MTSCRHELGVGGRSYRSVPRRSDRLVRELCDAITSVLAVSGTISSSPQPTEPCSSLGRIASESEPPNLPTEKNARSSPIEPQTPHLRFRFARPQPPKPPGIAGFSRSDSGYVREVSDLEDSIAVGGV
jgi:hypothetical protein